MCDSFESKDCIISEKFKNQDSHDLFLETFFWINSYPGEK